MVQMISTQPRSRRADEKLCSETKEHSQKATSLGHNDRHRHPAYRFGDSIINVLKSPELGLATYRHELNHLLKRAHEPQRPPHSASSADHKHFATGSHDGSAAVWSTETGQKA